VEGKTSWPEDFYRGSCQNEGDFRNQEAMEIRMRSQWWYISVVYFLTHTWFSNVFLHGELLVCTLVTLLVFCGTFADTIVLCFPLLCHAVLGAPWEENCNFLLWFTYVVWGENYLNIFMCHFSEISSIYCFKIWGRYISMPPENLMCF
jgi:hypothetical protein